MEEKDWDKSWSRTAMCPQQGCTWLKALGPLCTPKSEVNLSKIIDDQMVSLWEHVSQAVSEPVRVSWLEETSTSSCLRKLRGFPRAYPTSTRLPLWGAHLLGSHRMSPVLNILFSVLGPDFPSCVPLSFLAPRTYSRMALL